MLKLKRIAINTQHENIVILHRACTELQAEQFRAIRRVRVTHKDRVLYGHITITDDSSLVGPDEVGLMDYAFANFGLAEGTPITLSEAAPPHSLEAIYAKIRGEEVKPSEMESIIGDIAASRYSSTEIAAFLVAAAYRTSPAEVLSQTRAMVRSGRQLQWDAPQIVDKHSIGGIPGNRTSMIVVPIVAAHGLVIPKTSSRAITSPCGTADTMETLTNVDLELETMQAVVEATGGCLVSGNRINISPADDTLIQIERQLDINSVEQMVASILSKKIAAGVTHLVLDIPVGPTAKIRDAASATRLQNLFEFVAAESGLNVKVLQTAAPEPIGRGVGPVLEARDVMQVLRGSPEAPRDLREKALLLAGAVLEFDPNVAAGDGILRAQQLIESGAALARMEQMIAGQGARPIALALGDKTWELCAPYAGHVANIDCWRIKRIARLAGAPLSKGAGLDLLKKLHDPVEQGEPLYRLHAEYDAAFGLAQSEAQSESGYLVTARA